MKWRIIAVGKPALAYAREGVAEYTKRLRRYVDCEIHYLKDGGSPSELAARMMKMSDGCLRIVLDERGDQKGTDAVREWVDRWEIDGGIKSIAVLVGGADGHSEELREAADLVLGLSRLTLQHELALVVLLEQIYRVYTLKKGEPYHR